MTYNWKKPSTWREDLGQAKRISDYEYYFTSLPKDLSPAAYHYVICNIQKPNGTYARAKVTSTTHRTKDELRSRLQKEIRKRYF
ncbi:MAG: hypothetical protein HY513_03410 [Candidatus Aenigmarchaeota archaeon]|nr:hypothetical protein [Candidatus Aenigmarchaeota archaeon]